MNFIKMFFKSKLTAVKLLWEIGFEAWEAGRYSLAIPMLLWSVFCSTVGVVLLPFDLAFTAICYILFSGYRETMDEFCEDLYEFDNDFQELREES